MSKACQVCARIFDPQDGFGNFKRANHPDRRDMHAWAEDVCEWCFQDFARFRPQSQQTQEAFNNHIAKEIELLAIRSRKGMSLFRCEAICTYTHLNSDGALPLRCRQFATRVVDGHHVCGTHMRFGRKGTALQYADPAPPRFFFAARSAEDLAEKIKKDVPADWLPALATALAKS